MEDNVSLVSDLSEDFEVINGQGDSPLRTVTNNPLPKETSDSTSDNMPNTENRKGSNQMEENNYMYALSPTSPQGETGHLIRSVSSQLQDHTTFHRIYYLGCAAISMPRSEAEIQKNLAILNDEQSPESSVMEITLSVPGHSEGSVVLFEAASGNELASFPIHHIMFCARGLQDSKESQCFAFTCTQGSTPDTAIFQCHAFRCDVPEAVMKILQCFAVAFRQVPKLPSVRTDSIPSDKGLPFGSSIQNNERGYTFEALLEIKEEDVKGGLTSCPRDRDYFKFRTKWEKKLSVTLQQTSANKELPIERCFGLLICPGRNIRQSDMQLIEMETFNKSNSGDKTVYNIVGHWNPNEAAFEVLNTETPRDTRVYFTIAIDLVIAGIQEPVRFIIETKAKIVAQNERFWYFAKKAFYESFHLRLKELENSTPENPMFELISIESSTQLKSKKSLLSLVLNHSTAGSLDPSQSISSPDSDDDEPLLSGTGEVRKECTDLELESWAEVLGKWRPTPSIRPRQLPLLVRQGVPEAVRGEVWQLLADSRDNVGLAETYRLLINKESSSENVIQRDIHRTFPAHEFFKDGGPGGQDSLYKLCKAYSLYDQEVGYCQGLSFLAAALLLHMPEEMAFGLLIKIMFEYKFRELFKNGLEELHRRLYLLQKLMEEQVPELSAHFADLGVEPHMFASQWFLTLFTAKFPLCIVYYILDIFLLDGMVITFQVALALLKVSKKELLALDFEGVLKFFRVSLPKKYRTEETAKSLLQAAVTVKVKKLKKFEKEYLIMKEQEKLNEDPVIRLQRENKLLLDNNMRLEQENDDLAQELIVSKLQLHQKLEASEEVNENYQRDMVSFTSQLKEAEEEKKRLETEVVQLKEVCRRELQQSEAELSRTKGIVSNYKQICNKLSSQLEVEQCKNKDSLADLKSKIRSCSSCSHLMDQEDSQLPPETKSDDSAHFQELELELAQTKLALVEAQCKNQDLTHQLNNLNSEMQATKNTWFQKTFSTIRDAAKKENVQNT